MNTSTSDQLGASSGRRPFGHRFLRELPAGVDPYGERDEPVPHERAGFSSPITEVSPDVMLPRGLEVHMSTESVIQCPHCKAAVGAADAFCPKCGTRVEQAPTPQVVATIAPAAAVETAAAPMSQPPTPVLAAPATPLVASPRSKTVAVVLAVVVASFTWLYTYRLDKKKFWIGMALSVLGAILSAVGIGLLFIFGVWLWAVVDRVRQPESWYRSYQAA